MKKYLISSTICLLMSINAAAQVTLYSQDFEGPDFDTYTLFDGGANPVAFNQVGENYIVRTDPNAVPVGNVITGFTGNVIALEDTDDAGFFGEPFLRTDAFSISGYTNIEIEVKFAAGSGGDGSYETSDYLDVDYRIDGGSWVQAHRLEGSSSGLFYYDALNNGVTGNGDDINVDHNAQALSQSFTVSGSVMELRFTMGSQGDHEEMMFDDIIVREVVVCNDPTVSAFTSGPDSLCPGESSTLTVNGLLNDATSWHLYTDGCGTTPVTSDTSGVFSVSPTITTTYYVRGEDGPGCVDEATIGCSSVTVTVNPLPTVSYTSPGDLCVDAGTQTGLSGGTPGGGVYSGPGVTDDGNGSTYSFNPSAAGAGVHTFTYDYTDGNGCGNTANDSLEVFALPVISAGPDQALCNGDSTIVTGSGGSSYSWDNGVVDGVPFLPPLGMTMYTVTGTDVNGCSETDSLTLIVDSIPSVNGGADQVVCDGEMITLSGSNAITYSWDNGVTDGVPFVQPVGSGIYIVVGTDGNGCSDSDSVEVTVNALPDTSVTQAGNTLTSTNNNATYQWIDCTGGIIPGATSQSFQPAANGSYAIILSENGCSDTSACYLVTSVGLNASQYELSPSVFPNPTKGVITIDLGAVYREISISLTDIRGRQIMSKGIGNVETFDLTIVGEPGMYFLQLSCDERFASIRLIKQ